MDKEALREKAVKEFARLIGMDTSHERHALEFGFNAGWKADKWRRIETEDDLPKEDGVYLWTCSFGEDPDVRKIQLLTMSDGTRRIGPSTNLPLDAVKAWMPLPEPFRENDQG